MGCSGDNFGDVFLLVLPMRNTHACPPNAPYHVRPFNYIYACSHKVFPWAPEEELPFWKRLVAATSTNTRGRKHTNPTFRKRMRFKTGSRVKAQSSDVRQPYRGRAMTKPGHWHRHSSRTTHLRSNTNPHLPSNRYHNCPIKGCSY